MTVEIFGSEEEIADIGEGVIARTLAKAYWTHAAHFAAALWILARRPDLVASRDMPAIIRAYNEATGVANTESSGYHETITQASLRAASAFLDRAPLDAPLHVVCNTLLSGHLGQSDWLLAYWRKQTLYSVEARRCWIQPDLQPLPF